MLAANQCRVKFVVIGLPSYFEFPLVAMTIIEETGPSLCICVKYQEVPPFHVNTLHQYKQIDCH